MIGKACLTAAAMTIAVGLSGQPATAQTSVKAGVLTCDVASGWSFVFGSTRDLKCTFSNSNGSVEHYTGMIEKWGVDIGYHGGGVMAWAVLAPTTDIPKGALAGSYGGATGAVAAGVGASANILVGGSSGKTLSLQPLSIEGMTGINLALGVAQVTLVKAE
jgi:Protein of unknown function (DUF992)